MLFVAAAMLVGCGDDGTAGHASTSAPSGDEARRVPIALGTLAADFETILDRCRLRSGH